MTDPRINTARRRFGPHRQGHPGLVYQKVKSVFCPTTRWVRGDENAPVERLLADRLEYEEIYDKSTVAWMGRVK